MLIKTDVYKFPIPGVEFEGRKIYIEARAEDSETRLLEIAYWIGSGLRFWRDIRGDKVTYTQDCEELKKTLFIE